MTKNGALNANQNWQVKYGEKTMTEQQIHNLDARFRIMNITRLAHILCYSAIYTKKYHRPQSTKHSKSLENFL